MMFDTDPNRYQVGGKHYKGALIQHWDICAEYDVGYLEGCATKYLLRWREKGGLDDLAKVQHYFEKLVDVVTRKGYKRAGYRPVVPEVKLAALFEVHDSGPLEIDLVRLFFRWTVGDFSLMRQLLEQLIKQAREEMALDRIDPTGMDHPFGYNSEEDALSDGEALVECSACSTNISAAEAEENGGCCITCANT